MKNPKGFTLIELLVSLIIISVLISYALPEYQQIRLNHLMNSERNRLTVSLNYARYYAIYKQSYIIVCPSRSGSGCDNQSNWYQGWIIFEDYDRNRQLDDDDNLLRIEDPMVKQIKATSSLYRQKVRFNAIGYSPGTNMSINFCDSRGSEFAKSVIINNAGRVKQSDPISDNVCN